MTRLVIRQALLFIALLTVPVLLIRAQLYDDSPLRALLTPAPDCAPPCFMGLQPGRTTIWEALDLLRNHAWVRTIGDYEFENSKSPDGTITIMLRWEWSGAQPALIDPANRGAAWVLDDVLVSVDVDILPRYGDIQLVLGPPESEQLYTQTAQGGQVYTHYAWYPEPGILMIGGSLCPVDDVNWNRVTLHWSQRPLQLYDSVAERRAC